MNSDVDVSPDEIPAGFTADYMLEPAPALETEDTDSGMIVFCIDISGSMCITTQVPALQGDRDSGAACAVTERSFFVAEWKALRKGARKSKNEMYISRLECVQEAVKR